MRDELQTQRRMLRTYVIMWFVSVVAAALVTSEFDTELIRSMGPEGTAILAGISFSTLLCFVMTMTIQVSRTGEKIWILKQWIEADEDESEKEKSETED